MSYGTDNPFAVRVMVSDDIYVNDIIRGMAICLLLIGLKDCALETGASVTSAQSVLSPWLTIG